MKKARINTERCSTITCANYGEANFSDDPGSEKPIFICGVKYPEQIMNYTKGSTPIMFAGTTDGVLLEPYVVHKTTNM